MKNRSKLLLSGIITCALLFAVLFLVRTCGRNIPGLTDGFYILSEAIRQPVTLDLNTASAEDLDTIPGIGSGLAQNIVAYRKKYGKYVDIDELLNIRGMSDELYAQIKNYVCLGGSQ